MPLSTTVPKPAGVPPGDAFLLYCLSASGDIEAARKPCHYILNCRKKTEALVKLQSHGIKKKAGEGYKSCAWLKGRRGGGMGRIVIAKKKRCVASNRKIERER